MVDIADDPSTHLLILFGEPQGSRVVTRRSAICFPLMFSVIGYFDGLSFSPSVPQASRAPIERHPIVYALRGRRRVSGDKVSTHPACLSRGGIALEECLRLHPAMVSLPRA